MITLFPSRCYNGGKQHRFEARVTAALTGGANGRIEGMMSGSDLVRAIEAQKNRVETYHGDVCRWCGTVVNRQPKKE